MVFLTLVGTGVVLGEGGVGDDLNPTPNDKTITYTYFTKDVKEGKSHKLTMGGFRYMNDSATTWKSIDRMPSLKEAYDLGLIEVQILENDARYRYEINDLNYTYIDISPVLTSKADLNKDIPITIYSITYNFNETSVSEERNAILSSSFNYADLSGRQSVTKNFDNSIFGKEIKIGDNSTIIRLSETGDNYIYEDCYYEQRSADGVNNNQTLNNNYLVFDAPDDGTGEVPIVKINITAIPEGAIIINATFEMLVQLSGGGTLALDVFDSLNQSWNETFGWQTNAMQLSDFYAMSNEKIRTNFRTTVDTGWINITSLEKGVQNSLDEGYDNVTFIFNHTGSTFDYRSSYSKEASGNPANALTVEYEEGVIEVPPYNGIGNYSIDCHTYRILTSSSYIDLNGNYIHFYGDPTSNDYITVKTNLTNVKGRTGYNCTVYYLPDTWWHWNYYS